MNRTSYILIWAVVILLGVNQFFIGGFMPKSTGNILGAVASIFGAQAQAAKEIIAPKLNPDGRTTSLVKQPTITEVPAEPKGMDPIEAAKIVMVPTGTPFYAPQGVSFDDPLGALSAWGQYEDSIQLSGELQSRWEKIINTLTCDFCCGTPTRVTVVNQCGCAHAKAFRSIAKYLLKNYGDKYSDDEIMGEIRRWQGIWYPKPMVQLYLLATGRSDILGVEPHGGSGPDGRHGIQ